jgi:hypothetical protein
MLIHYAMMQYLPFAAYQIKNGGISKHTSENAESVTKDEVDYLVQKERNFAEYYTRRFIDYMSFNTSFIKQIITRMYIQIKTIYSMAGYSNNYKPKVTNLVKLQIFLEKIENKEKENGK